MLSDKKLDQPKPKLRHFFSKRNLFNKNRSHENENEEPTTDLPEVNKANLKVPTYYQPMNRALPLIQRESCTDLTNLLETRFTELNIDNRYRLPGLVSSVEAADIKPSQPKLESKSKLKLDSKLEFEFESKLESELELGLNQDEPSQFLPPLDFGKKIRMSIQVPKSPMNSRLKETKETRSNQTIKEIKEIKELEFDQIIKELKEPKSNQIIKEIVKPKSNQIIKELKEPRLVKSQHNLQRNTVQTDNDMGFRLLSPGKNLSVRQMRTKNCPPPLTIYQSAFRVPTVRSHRKNKSSLKDVEKRLRMVANRKVEQFKGKLTNPKSNVGSKLLNPPTLKITNPNLQPEEDLQPLPSLSTKDSSSSGDEVECITLMKHNLQSTLILNSQASQLETLPSSTTQSHQTTTSYKTGYSMESDNPIDLFPLPPAMSTRSSLILSAQIQSLNQRRASQESDRSLAQSLRKRSCDTSSSGETISELLPLSEDNLKLKLTTFDNKRMLLRSPSKQMKFLLDGNKKDNTSSTGTPNSHSASNSISNSISSSNSNSNPSLKSDTMKLEGEESTYESSIITEGEAEEENELEGFDSTTSTTHHLAHFVAAPDLIARSQTQHRPSPLHPRTTVLMTSFDHMLKKSTSLPRLARAKLIPAAPKVDPHSFAVMRHRVMATEQTSPPPTKLSKLAKAISRTRLAL